MPPRPFPVEAALDAIAPAVARFPPPSMFELARRGHGSLFEQVIGCIISVRTLEEVSLGAALRLFELATDPAGVATLEKGQIELAISNATYPMEKTGRITEIARIADREHGGSLPCDRAAIEALPGVGPKCAALSLGIACGAPGLPVDVHVHRIANRWGAVQTRTPERTMRALQAIVPPERWLEVNRLLVPFGKHICTRERPRCRECPVSAICGRVGVPGPR